MRTKRLVSIVSSNPVQVFSEGEIKEKHLCQCVVRTISYVPKETLGHKKTCIVVQIVGNLGEGRYAEHFRLGQ